MDRRVWIVLSLIILALGLWYVAGGGKKEGQERGWQPDLRSDPDAPTPTPSAQETEPSGAEPAVADPTPEPTSPPASPRGGSVIPGKPGLPLANVRMPLAQWTDARLMEVLDELAKVAGKRLLYASDTRQRARKLRVTLERREATVAQLLDLVLGRREDLNWTMRGGAIEIYLDDD